MEYLQFVSAILCGALVGFTLGLIGGGGSIMATPLFLCIVGLQPHVAIGTGALAVSVNAFFNFGSHARAGNVRWRTAIVFAGFGVAGAAIGSGFGKAFVTGARATPVRRGADLSKLRAIETARVRPWIMPALMPCIRTGTKRMRIVGSS